jgi:hypothetical protein
MKLGKIQDLSLLLYPSSLSLFIVASIFATAIADSGSSSSSSSSVNPSKISSQPVEVSKYLAIMRPLTQGYLKIMLSLIAHDSEQAEDVQVSALEVAELAKKLALVQAPPEVANEQGKLIEPLSSVAAFFKTGGASTHGFHGALALAQQMQAVSNNYHNAVLAIIRNSKFTLAKDPFIAEGAFTMQSDSQGLKSQKGKSPDKVQERLSVKDSNIRGTDYSISTYEPSKLNSNESSSMINGVDGAQGMSGLFNGLGGTGTNGLIDGMGFSSGLNGFVNGAGASSGMSGMLNSTDNGGSP